MFSKLTHETFANKLFQNLRAHSRVGKAEFSETDFAISHYAGKVSYQTDSFLDKNRDYVVVDHRNLMSSSKCSFIVGLFAALAEKSSRSSYKFSSVASRFEQQLQALMDTLSSTEPHYVRCVKPNSVNRPQKFENQSMLHQLRCRVSDILSLFNFYCVLPLNGCVFTPVCSHKRAAKRQETAAFLHPFPAVFAAV
ncbi:putative myosin ATPase [Helianthus anomalus]